MTKMSSKMLSIFLAHLTTTNLEDWVGAMVISYKNLKRKRVQYHIIMLLQMGVYLSYLPDIDDIVDKIPNWCVIPIRSFVYQLKKAREI